MWCYWTTSGTQTTIISFNNGSNSGINLWKNTSNQLVADDGINGQTAFSTVTPTINAWNHIAFVRNVTTTSAYVNGVLAGSNSFTPQTTSTVSVGRYNASPYYYFPGYISNLRVVNGTAVYTGAFTPPSLQPLTTAGSTSALCYTSTTNVNTSFAATSTSLLLNFIDSNLTDGVFNAGQNNTFLDSGPNSLAITRNGTPTQGALTPYIPNGYWSGYFSSSYLSVADNAALEFGSSSFCIEVFYFPTATPAAQAIFIKQPNPSTDYGFRILAVNGVLTAYISSGNTSDDIVNGVTFGTLQSNSWNHIAVYRVGTAIYGSLNGTITTLNANTNLSVWNNTGAWVLSASSTGTNPSTGYFSNWRIVVGSSVYTGSSATVPTAPLTAITNTQLLTCQSNRFRDNSSNAFTVTVNGTPSIQAFKPFNPPVAYSPSVYGGSGYFGGNGNYLYKSAPGTGIFDPGNTGAWTIEMWIYPIAANYFFAFGNGAAYGNGIYCYWSANAFALGQGNGSGANPVNITTAANYPANAWYHFAGVKDSSNNITLYINGVSAGTATNITATIASGCGAIVNGLYDNNGLGNNGSTCYLSNIRWVKGTAVYSGTFTPPTLPLSTTGVASVASYSSTTNVNTSFPSTLCGLLLNFTNSGITDFSTNNNLTTVGDAKVSTTAAKYGLASFFFDGTGDYLNLGSGPSLDVNNGDFTIEGWIYPVTASNYNEIITLGNAIAGGYSAIRLRMNSSRQLELYMSTNGSSWSTFGTTTDTVSLNTWTYITLVRSGSSSGNVKLYFNGTATSLSLTFTGTGYSGGQYSIGCVWSSSAPSSFWNGYLQDFRITKGYARYLSNFTTPTDSFTQGGGIGSVPGAPTIGTATKTNSTTATVTFTPPANTGGYAITTYTATSSIGNITGTSTTSPITISGLTSGTGYSFTVTATNSLGVSSPSAASNTVGGTAIRSFLITQMDPIYTLNTTITTAIGITKIQSYTMAILYGDD
jgi:hypothetical protein